VKRALLLCASACAAPAPRTPLANTAPAPPLPEDTFSTRELAGPYRTLDDYCADATRRAREKLGDREPEMPLGCQKAVAFVDEGPEHAGTASLVPFRYDDGGFGTRCALVIPIGDKLWADDDAMPCRPDDGGSGYDRITVEQLEWREVVAEAPGPELELGVMLERTTAGNGHIVEEYLTTCGIGASGRPRCTPAIPVSLDAMSAFQSHPHIARDGTLTFALDLTRDEGTVDEDYLADFRRSYALRFP
jgi:hypothetical protein